MVLPPETLIYSSPNVIGANYDLNVTLNCLSAFYYSAAGQTTRLAIIKLGYTLSMKTLATEI